MHLDLGDAPGRANPGDKLMTLVASALAGGVCIDDADALRSGGSGRVLGCVVKAPSTLGTFLRSFRWDHVRQLDRVSRELLARAWAAGAGPGEGPLTIDLDSTICETYGLGKEGARRHGYTGQRGYHPLLAVAAGTGEVLMARLREGRANTARGAAHFLRETVGRVSYAGATGQLTMRADSGFYTHAVVAVCRKMDVCFSITVRQHQGLRHLIEAIPEANWTPISYWMDGAADVAEIEYTPFQTEPDAAPVRLIVRRVKPTPGSQLARFANYSFHAFITDREGDVLDLEADHRRHAEIENAIRDLKYGVGLNHLPSGRFAANAAWLAVQVMAHPGPVDRPHRSGRATGNHQDPQTTLLLPRRTAHPLGAPPHHASSQTLALGNPVQSRPGPAPSHSSPGLTTTSATGSPASQPKVPQSRASTVRDCFLMPADPAISPGSAAAGRQPPLGVAATLRIQPNPSGSKPHHPIALALIPSEDSGLPKPPLLERKQNQSSETNGRPIGTGFHVPQLSPAVTAYQLAHLLGPPSRSLGIEMLPKFLNMNAALVGQRSAIQPNIVYRPKGPRTLVFRQVLEGRYTAVKLVVLEIVLRRIGRSSIGIHVPVIHRNRHIPPSIIPRPLSKLAVNQPFVLSRQGAWPIVPLLILTLRTGIHQVQPVERQVSTEVRRLRTGDRVPRSEVFHWTGLPAAGYLALAEGAQAAELPMQPPPQQAIVLLRLRALAAG